MGLWDDIGGAIKGAVNTVEIVISGSSNNSKPAAAMKHPAAKKMNPSPPRLPTAAPSAPHASNVSPPVYDQTVIKSALQSATGAPKIPKANYTDKIVTSEAGAAVDLTTKQTMRARDASGVVVASVSRSPSGDVRVHVNPRTSRSTARQLVDSAPTVAKAVSKTQEVGDESKIAAALAAQASAKIAEDNLRRTPPQKVVNSLLVADVISRGVADYYRKKARATQQDYEAQAQGVVYSVQHNPVVMQYNKLANQLKQENAQIRRDYLLYNKYVQEGDRANARMMYYKLQREIQSAKADYDYLTRVLMPRAEQVVNGAQLKLSQLKLSTENKLVDFSAKIGAAEGTRAVAWGTLDVLAKRWQEDYAAMQSVLEEPAPLRIADELIAYNSGEGLIKVVPAEVKAALTGSSEPIRQATKEVLVSYGRDVKQRGNTARLERIATSPLVLPFEVKGAALLADAVGGATAGAAADAALTGGLAGYGIGNLAIATKRELDQGKSLSTIVREMAPAVITTSAAFAAGSVLADAAAASLFNPKVSYVRADVTEGKIARITTDTDALIARTVVPKKLAAALEETDRISAIVGAKVDTTLKVKYVPNPKNPLVKAAKFLNKRTGGKLSKLGERIKPAPKTVTKSVDTFVAVEQADTLQQITFEPPKSASNPLTPIKFSVKVGSGVQYSGEYIPLLRTVRSLKEVKPAKGIADGAAKGTLTIFRSTDASVAEAQGMVFSVLAFREGVSSGGKAVVKSTTRVVARGAPAGRVGVTDISKITRAEKLGVTSVESTGKIALPRLGEGKYEAYGIFRDAQVSDLRVLEPPKRMAGKGVAGTKLSFPEITPPKKIVMLKDIFKKQSQKGGKPPSGGNGKVAIVNAKDTSVAVAKVKTEHAAVTAAMNAAIAKAVDAAMEAVQPRATLKPVPLAPPRAARTGTAQLQAAGPEVMTPKIRLGVPSVGAAPSIILPKMNLSELIVKPLGAARRTPSSRPAALPSIAQKQRGGVVERQAQQGRQMVGRELRQDLVQSTGQWQKMAQKMAQELGVGELEMSVQRIETLSITAPKVRTALTEEIPLKPFVPPIKVPPIIKPLPIGFASASKGVGERKASRGKQALGAKKGRPVLFVHPTGPVTDWMVKHFGKVIVPRSPKVARAYAEWLSLPVGNFNPLKFVRQGKLSKKVPSRRLKMRSIFKGGGI